MGGSFSYARLSILIIAEANLFSSPSLKKKLAVIASMVQHKKQTVLVAGDGLGEVQRLVKDVLGGCLSASKPLEREGVGSEVSARMHGYALCSCEYRFPSFCLFLRESATDKILVYFGTCASSTLYGDFLGYFGMRAFVIHNKMDLLERKRILSEFSGVKGGILMSSVVAMQDLDPPAVDWIVVYDPPGDPETYLRLVHGKSQGSAPRSLLFLRNCEKAFLKKLEDSNVSPYRCDLDIKNPVSKDIQKKLEGLVLRNEFVAKYAKASFYTFLYYYLEHKDKSSFNIKQLNMIKIAKSFGIFNLPHFDPRKSQLLAHTEENGVLFM